MKQTFILSTATLIFASILFVSCKPSRVWATKEKEPSYHYKNVQQPPPQRYYASINLIISPTPGFRMSQYPDGRFYHRSAQGYLYWKGYDNRFYLDRNYLDRISYSKWEYKEWKRYSKQNNRR